MTEVPVSGTVTPAPELARPDAAGDRPAWARPRFEQVGGREASDFQTGVGADDEFFATPAGS